MNRYVILIVDDDAHFRQGLRRLFHTMRDVIPADTLEAVSGEDALRIMAERQVGCILLDQHMPGGSGTDWIQRILAARPDAAIIMVTGVGNEQVAVEAMKRGAMDYLVKGSISPESLQRAVVNAIDRVNLRRSIERQREQLLDAERQRVMIESLGAACHHLGQPATVIATYLHMMRQRESDAERLDMIDNCIEATRALSDILDRLRGVSEYRTEPYLAGGDDTPWSPARTILTI